MKEKIGRVVFCGLLGTMFFWSSTAMSQGSWRKAARESVGTAPLASEEPTAIVQVYGARTWGWKGAFAIHTWVAVKAENASSYKVAHVIGWRAYRNQPVVVFDEDLPDRKWFGAHPELISELRGEAAARAIPKVEEAIASYPYQKSYRVWPGPNSNTFVAHIIRSVPELKVELPSIAIGKDWLNNGRLVDLSQSRTGFQFSILGAAGFTLGLAEGIEVNVLGLTFGIDFLRPALKLPLIGRLGFPDAPPGR